MRPARARPDALLGAVRILLSVSMIGAIVFTAIPALSVPTLPLWWPAVEAGLTRHAGGPLPADLRYMIGGFLALVAVMAALGFLFLRLLRRIVDSVAEGDPFIPENAVRLDRMGWLAVSIQLIAIPAGGLTGWIAHVGRVPPVDVGLSVGGILLALILFVLARVFRRGAAMRDDLEGTV